MNKLTCGFLLASAAIALPMTAAAQDWSLDPTYGTIALQSGFENDPRKVNLAAGGSIEADLPNPDCVGFVANAPDYRVNYEPGAAPLILSVVSNSPDADTTLVVNDPNGEWICDDDGAGDAGGGVFDPLLVISNPQSGQYDIWVGNFDDPGLIEAQLRISEITP